MGNTNCRDCPVCGDDRNTSMYLMPNSPYICERCNTEWNTKTGVVEKFGKVPEGKVKIPEFTANSLSYLPRGKEVDVVKLESVINTMVKSVNSYQIKTF